MSGTKTSETRRALYHASLAAAVSILGGAMAAHADTLVTSFEGASDFDYSSTNAGTVTVSASHSAGVTNGSTALHVTSPQSWWIDFGYINVDPTALSLNTTLEFDVVSSTGVNFVPVFHNDPQAGSPGSGGWNQGPGLYVASSSTPTTVAFDYSSYAFGPTQTGLPAGSSYTLQLQGSTGNPVDFYIDNVRLVGAGTVAVGGDGEWKHNGSGDWVDPANWTPNIPGVAGDYGTFGTNGGNVNTASQIVVTTNRAITMSKVFFDKGAGGYKIAGTFPVSLLQGVEVISGNHEIAAALTISSGASINTAAGSSVTLRNLSVSGYGSFTKVGDGTLNADKIVNCSLTVTNGALNLLPGNTQGNGWMYGITIGSLSTANFADASITNNGLYGNGTAIINGKLTTGQYLASGSGPGSYSFDGTLAGTGSVVVGGVTGSSNDESQNTVNFTGPVTISGGITLNSGFLNTTSLGAGPFAVNAGTAQVTAKATPNTQTSKIPSLTIAATGAKVDLTNNALVIDYTGPVGSLVGTTRQQIQSGQLGSSLADATHRLGYGDNALLNKTTFSGVTVDPSSLLIKYTYGGDANLDGQVDVTDLGALATNWQTSNVWTGGDFNYDGFVDVSDLGILATDWQLGVGSPLGPGSLDAAMASVGLGGVSVPEPTSLGMICIGLAAAASRRSARRTRRS